MFNKFRSHNPFNADRISRPDFQTSISKVYLDRVSAMVLIQDTAGKKPPSLMRKYWESIVLSVTVYIYFVIVSVYLALAGLL